MFIPHEGNNHHPHFWKKNSVALFFALILMVELGFFAQSLMVFKKGSYLAAVLPAVLASMTNDQRVNNNAPTLSENSLLDKAAQLKAEDMAKRGYFAHNTPEGYLPWYWLDKVGYKYSHAGENLAVNFNDSKDVVDAWMNSPTHRANIVKAIYTETGLGVAEGVYEGRPAIFVSQFFATPDVAPTAQVTAVPQTSPQSSIATLPIKPAINTQPPQISKSTSGSKSKIASTTEVAGAEVNAKNNVNLDIATTSNVNSTSSTSTAVQTNSIQKTNILNKIATSPRHVGMTALLLLLGFVIGAFLLIIFINGKIHHPKIILLALSFIVVIVGAIILNNTLLKDDIQIGESGGEVSRQ